jgi:hypothetical protein
MNEMINAVRYDRLIDFRERYRSVDVLLVDDVQFLAGKEGTQNEFFHTFNALYDSQKQIVLSSDCPPHEIEQLEERLRSRFEWGLIADIQSPDLETKVAILKKKAEAEAVPLPDSVAIYIAGRIKSNIRELEGSLIRLIAYASLTGREISLELTQDVLRNMIDSDAKAVTIETIQKFVSEYYQLKVAELKSRNNSKSVAMPRQVAMYLCKHLTHASLPEIGRSFGGKHHSTVIHSIRKVEELRKIDRDFNSLIGGTAGGNVVRQAVQPRPTGELVSEMEQSLSDPVHENILRAIQAKAELSDFLANDDVISGYDPEEVIRAYNEIARLSPRSATQPAVIRPLLEKRLTQGRMEPFEAAEMANIEKTISESSPTPAPPEPAQSTKAGVLGNANPLLD